MKAGVKGKKKNLVLYIVIAAVVVVLVVLVLVSNMMKGNTLPSVNVETVTTGDVQEKVDTSGTVESQNKKVFFSPVNAEVQNLNFQVGDSVAAGTQLIDFDLENLERDNQKAELTAKAGQYGYNDSIKKSNKAANDVADAKAKVATLEGQVDAKKQEVEDLTAQISSAQAQAAADAQNAAEDSANQAAAQYKKDKEAYDKALADAQNAVTDAQTKYNQEKTNYDMAYSKWDSSKTSTNEQAVKEQEKVLTDAQNKLDAAKASRDNLLNNPPVYQGASGGTGEAGTADTSQLQLQLQNAQSELAELQSDLATNKSVAESGDAGVLSEDAKKQLQVNNNLTELEAKTLDELIAEGKKGIQAEFTGVISDSKIVDGAAVTQGMEMFTLESTEDVSVSVTVSKYDIDKIKVGQKAKVTIAGKTYDGTLTKINKVAIPNEKGTPVLGAQVHIDNPDQDIYLGVDAKVTIVGNEAKNAVLLPVELVNTGKTGSFCYVVEDGKVAKRTIETGIASDSYIEVKSGLKKGDVVITDSPDTLTEGLPVEAKEASGQTDGEAQQDTVAAE
ncbi:efflux RND transporter periplasmic adaptor subunit [Lactonifactor longoviformis]|uniref:RND family efflux transporter, MFP subunit n=1 Tax=Lactonifactor longoviformis DSM 17459 TaxID=1122155 RepID=A0A1M4V5J8_9CLOT|nr:efflux RND transporter periplasmic adaptor subunit [Lactonifactor longoviformis]POP31696.1 efflux RND transporter periplasmic adaptor subunit [Lactonifactor longoviformis]SHE64172.1 RND family efflux transporter, MFP subunit [Lactonifactor longoviformis DSM 17459]